MKTEVIKIDQNNMDTEALERAAAIIRDGGLVAFPTETVYGLGADALSAEASKKIYAAKGRPSDNPLIVHVAEFSDMEKIAQEMPEEAKKLADAGCNGKTVVMGIRPEDIGDSQIEIEAHKDAVFETDVTGYELLGSEVLLYFNVAGTAMTAKVDSRTTARMGDHITLAIDPEKIHCFDKETELTITN